MKVKIQTITPATAKEWLKEKNVNNRNVRQSLVDYYANEMIAGRWKDNDQAISFFEDGTLANGQHRLLGVAQSGVTIQTIVAYDLPKSAMSGIDVGGKRNAGDFLQLHHGVENAQNAASISRQIMSVFFYYQNFTYSGDVLLKVIRHYEDEIETATRTFHKFKQGRKAWVMAAVVIAMKTHKTQIEEFATAVATGELIKKGDPAYAWRNFLIEGSSEFLRAAYKRSAYEGLFNAMFNHVHKCKITTIKKGVQGVTFFVSAQRKFVELMRKDIEHLLS